MGAYHGGLLPELLTRAQRLMQRGIEAVGGAAPSPRGAPGRICSSPNRWLDLAAEHHGSWGFASRPVRYRYRLVPNRGGDRAGNRTNDVVSADHDDVMAVLCAAIILVQGLSYRKTDEPKQAKRRALTVVSMRDDGRA